VNDLSSNQESRPEGSRSDPTFLTRVRLRNFQSGNKKRPNVPLVGIEEPEMALHPGAAGVLRDGLRDASSRMQVLVTSHSPDLLDDKTIDDRSILVTSMENGITRIGPVDEPARSAMRERLYTAGELLRLDQLEPDPALVKQLDLLEEDSK
jgi:hypothetical protein